MVESPTPLSFATHFFKTHDKGKRRNPMPPKRRRRRPLSTHSTVNVRRDEFQEVLDTLHQHTRDLDIQLKRIAQLQADLDEIKRAWTKIKLV